MPGDVFEVNGIGRRGFIKLQPSGKFLVGPARLVPTASEDPLARLTFGGCFLDEFLDIGNGSRAVQHDVQFVARRAANVNMSVVEAGHHEMSAKVNRLRGRA